MLQAQFAVVRKPSLAWDVNALHNMMLCYIIMHNMIVEDERDTYENYTDIQEYAMYKPTRCHTRCTEEDNDNFIYHTDRIVDINIYLQHKAEIEDQQIHLSLRNDLIDLIWSKFGRSHVWYVRSYYGNRQLRCF